MHIVQRVDHRSATDVHSLFRIELFGGFRVWVGDERITRFRTRKTGELLAYLACRPGDKISREELIELLFPDLTPEAARNNLSQLLSFLRRQLACSGAQSETVLSVDRFSIGLNQEQAFIDLSDFRENLRIVRASQVNGERLQALQYAVNICRGPLLPDIYDDWASLLRVELAEENLKALRLLVRLLAKTGDTAGAVDYAQKAVTADPLREESHRDLIQLYYATGRTAAALEQYRTLEETLRKEFGLLPAPATRRLLVEIQADGRIEACKPLQPGAKPETVAALKPANAPARSASLKDLHAEDVANPLWPASAGTLTILVADIPRPSAASSHDQRRFKAEISRLGGVLMSGSGQVLAAVFCRASDALKCSFTLRSIADSSDAESADSLAGIRIALDTREVRLKDGGTPLQAIEPATRLVMAAHTGQILCSASTAAIVERDSDVFCYLDDLGLYRLASSVASERVYCVRPSESSNAFPPLNATRGWLNYLPTTPTRFVGRQVELTKIQEAINDHDCRLLTLLGPGGVGKTRLAQELAHSSITGLNGAAWWVSLSDLCDASLLPTRLCESLHVVPKTDLPLLQQAAERLGRQHSLLILDNFEQLAEQGADTVFELLQLAPLCKVLVTSRQSLGLPGERLFQVDPLPVPARASEDVHNKLPWLEEYGHTSDPMSCLRLIPSVSLFVDRVRSVRVDFRLTERNVDDVIEICACLEGVPLALELAAGRAQVMSLSQIRAQLRERFELLVSRRRHVDQRHRTLWDAVEWSYALLPPQLQHLFDRLSVFRGGFTADAAATVCGEADDLTSPPSVSNMLDCLEQLSECSLVVSDEVDAGASMRFRMLETLREFGAIKLANSGIRAVIRTKHCDWAVQFASGLDDQSGDDEMERLMTRIAREYPNMEAALDWCAEGDLPGERGLALAAHLWRFWRIRGRFGEGLKYLKRAIGLPSSSVISVVRARALAAAAELANRQAEYSEAHRFGDESLSISSALQDRLGVARALYVLADTANLQGDDITSLANITQSLVIFREFGDSRYCAGCLNFLGSYAVNQGKNAEARQLYEESMAIAMAVGDRRMRASCLNNIGDMAVQQGNYKEAKALFEESLAISRDVGDLGGTAYCHNKLGYAVYLLRDFPASRKQFEESLMISREMANRPGIAWSLANLGYVGIEQGEFDLAKSYFEESLQVFTSLGDDPGIPYVLSGLAKVKERHDQVGLRTSEPRHQARC